MYLDDILISGTKSEEHLRRLDIVFQSFRRLKCEILVPSVTYLGNRIDAEGLHPERKAIKDAPEPRNVTELKSCCPITQSSFHICHHIWLHFISC